MKKQDNAWAVSKYMHYMTEPKIHLTFIIVGQATVKYVPFFTYSDRGTQGWSQSGIWLLLSGLSVGEDTAPVAWGQGSCMKELPVQASISVVHTVVRSPDGINADWMIDVYRAYQAKVHVVL